ncbi:MAG: hypothetical protein LBT15_07720 [Synergistaceae bacterium]|jgi:hypothetical protein|nr:hypothetical protein [Synergistaceae bacterium]
MKHKILKNLIGAIFCVALTFMLCAGAEAARPSGEDITVNNAVGTGATRESALERARRDAIEQGIGVFIDGYTSVKDYQVVTDKVFSTTQGIIKKFDILDERKDKDGMFIIEARAVVTAAALDGALGPVVLDMLGNRRVVVILDERIADKQPFLFTSEGEVAKVFQDSGLHIVDKDQADLLAGINLDEARQKQNEEEMLRIARNFKADILVSGKAYAGSFVSIKAGGRSIYSGRASIQLRAVLTNTAQQIGFDPVDADQKITRGTTAEDAAIIGFKHCAPRAAKSIVNAIAYMLFGSLGAPTYSVKIAGIPFDDVWTLQETLEELDEVKSVYQRSYDNEVLELDVISEMDANTLGRWFSKNGVAISRVSTQTVEGKWRGGQSKP